MRRNDQPLLQQVLLLIRGDPRVVVLWEALAFAFMGFWLLNPFFNTFSTSVTYVTMAKVADECIWGISFVVIALILFWASLDYRHKTLRSVGVFVGLLMWLLLGSLFGYSNITALGTSLFLAHAIIMAWAFLGFRLSA